MIERILAAARTCGYDFRRTANPADPLRHLFADWVDYYRMKYAIASVLQPRSILEIGVRYGYSARAFLEASPSAHYCGIDNGSEDYGGAGLAAAGWAEAITQAFDTQFLKADSQALVRFPGEEYDLVHVDGQQDEVGIRQDLEKAMSQSRFILVDGFTWMAENYRSGNQFLLEHRQDLAYYLVIPGYAGELLIRVSDAFRRRARDGREKGLEVLRPITTAGYDRERAPR